ncbi:MAG: anthranilate phosphoribosyltransferase, partial [Bacteroidota bacterium]
TFFNMLGPLVNPARPQFNMLGVFSNELSRLYQYVLQQTNRKYTIVYALDGYDEISLTGRVKIRTNHSENIYHPVDFGKEQLIPQALHGGDTVEEAAKIFVSILEGNGTPAQRDVVTANAGMAIHCLKPEQSISDCIAEAEASLLSKSALAQFKKLVN